MALGKSAAGGAHAATRFAIGEQTQHLTRQLVGIGD
jgi:hypothetical protein